MSAFVVVIKGQGRGLRRGERAAAQLEDGARDVRPGRAERRDVPLDHDGLAPRLDLPPAGGPAGRLHPGALGPPGRQQTHDVGVPRVDPPSAFVDLPLPCHPHDPAATGHTGVVRSWARRVDWCFVVAVPVVTLTALLDPVDALNSALAHVGLRWQRLPAPARTPGPAPVDRPGPVAAARAVPPRAVPAVEHPWAPGDVAYADPAPRRPRGSRPPGRPAASRLGRAAVRP